MIYKQTITKKLKLFLKRLERDPYKINKDKNKGKYEISTKLN